MQFEIVSSSLLSMKSIVTGFSILLNLCHPSNIRQSMDYSARNLRDGVRRMPPEIDHRQEHPIRTGI
jgi:hypothetical protein